MTNIWGGDFWKVINHIAKNYPDNPTEQDKNNHKDFFIVIGKVLPCNLCRNNYSKHFNDFELQKSLNSKNDLVKYVIDFHNKVNKSIGKKELDYDEAYAIIHDHFIFKLKHVFYILFLLMFIFILYLFFVKKIKK